MNRIIALIVFITLSSPGLAGEDYHAFAVQENARIQSVDEPYKGLVSSIAHDEKSIITPYESDAENARIKAQMLITGDTNNSDHSQDKRPMSSVLVFISFSMPDSSIKAKLRDAKRIRAEVIIRGLVNNSFKQTMVKMNKLIRESGADGVELNPVWFKRFNVETVPTVVVVPDGSRCITENTCRDDSDYDAISGDISLESALTEIANNGDTSNENARRSALILRGDGNA